MNIAINYASNRFVPLQTLQNQLWAKFHNNVKIFSFNKLSIKFILNELKLDTSNIKKVLEQPKGDGLWAWKILLINYIFSRSNNGDSILYLDSGGCPTKNVDYIFEEINSKKSLFCKVSGIENEAKCRSWLLSQPSLSSKIELINEDNLFALRKWDKREIDKSLDPNLIQIAGGIQGWLVCNENREIISELLHMITLENYDDNSNITNKSYIDHRHDQSVLSPVVYQKKLNILGSVPGILFHRGSI